MFFERGGKGQVAMEYLVIVGFVTVITIPLIIIYQQHSISTTEEITMNEVKQISKRMADATETVYYLGKPSKTTIKTYFPSNVESVRISNNEIIFNIASTSGVQEVVTYVPLNVSGNLSIHPGIHFVSVENRGGYIWISE